MDNLDQDIYEWIISGLTIDQDAHEYIIGRLTFDQNFYDFMVYALLCRIYDKVHS